jgi:flagellin-like protein
MKQRKGVSPVIATVVLIGVALFLALTMSAYYRETAYSQIRVEAIEFSHIYSITTTYVSNSKWQIEAKIINRGTQSIRLTKVSVNDREVDVYGLNTSSSLAHGGLIGTSLPVDGVNLLPSEELVLLIWVGEQLFSSGTTITVDINSVNNVNHMKFVKLV